MSSVLAPSFLLELGAYAIAAAGIRLFRNRTSQARQQEAQAHPETVHQHTSPRVIGLSQASPLLSTCRSSSRLSQPRPGDEVQSPQAAGISCKNEAEGQCSDAQVPDVVMPEAGAVLLPPQPITAVTETAATPPDVPPCIIAPADTAFGHVTALSLTPLPGSPVNRFDNMGSNSISSHSHNSDLAHGNASRHPDVMGSMSDDHPSAQNNTGVPTSNAACHDRAASKAPAAAAEEERQQLQDIISKDEQQDVSSEPDRVDAIWPENVEIAHRGVEASSAGDCDRSTGPSLNPMSEDDPDVDIMIMDDSSARDHMAVADSSGGGNDVISDSETSKQEEEEVASGMEWAWGADTADDDQCDNVDEGRSLLLSAIQKHKRSAEHDPENSELQLFVSKKRTCGPLIGGAEEEEVKGTAKPAAAVPGDGKAGEAKAAQPNNLLQEIASVTLRLLAGALRHSSTSEAAQPHPAPFSQAPAEQAEQSFGSDFINPAPSQAGQPLTESGIEEDEEGQVAEGSQLHSAGICVEAMPMLEEESEEAHQRIPTCSGQPSRFGCAHPDSLTDCEAEVGSHSSFGQPDQAMEPQHAAAQEQQDSIHTLTLIPMTHSDDSHSDTAEAKEPSQVADATHHRAALSIVPMTTEVETYHKGKQARNEDEGCGQQVQKPLLFDCKADREWVQRWVPRCRPSLPAAQLHHLSHHDAMTCPDSLPDAEAPRAMSLEPEADMAADDIEHGQISQPASDSAANAPAISLPSKSPTSQLLALRAAVLAVAVSMLGDSSSAAAISAPEAGASAAERLNPVDIAETRLAAPSGHCEGNEQAEVEGSDELCPVVNAPVERSAQRAEETEESGDEAHASKGDKYQPGKHVNMLCGSGVGRVAQPTLNLPRLLRYAGSCFSKSVVAQSRPTRGGSYQPNFCHESDYLFHDSPDQLQPESGQQREQLQSSGLLNRLPDHMDDVCSPDVHQVQHGQLAQASPALSDDYESRPYRAEHPGADAQTDWGRELPIVDSAPPIAANSPPGSPTSSSAWGSPHEPAVNSPSGSLAHSYSPEWGSAHQAVSNRPQYRAVPASPAAQSSAWGSPLRASRSSPLRCVSPTKSPVWQSPGRAAGDSLDCHSPGSPAASPATLPHGGTQIRTDHSKPTRWSRSSDSVPPFWNFPKVVSASAARTADSSPDYWQSLKEAEDRLSEPARSPKYLPSGGGMEEEDRQMCAEPDHEEEDNGMAEFQQGQNEEEDQPDASKYEGAYARPIVGKTTGDYVHDAWDLSESSDEDAEDKVPARGGVEHEAEDNGLQVRGSKQGDSGEEYEGVHGARAAAGSSPGQALSPGPDRMLSQHAEEDCMLEEEDCKEKYLAAARESEVLLDEEDIDIEDDDVQFMGETGPDPSKSAFQLARKRLASIRASQRCGEEEDDVELYPGVQDLISGTLQSNRNTAHQVCDFAAELSKGSTILRHFKRLRKLPSASRTSEERSAFWSRHSSGLDLQPGLRAGEADQPQAQPVAHASARIDHCGKGGKHRNHGHHSHRHHHHHRHGRRGSCGWRAEATAVTGRSLDSALSGSLSGGLPDGKEDEADRSSGQML